jgi:hypothetical protein
MDTNEPSARLRAAPPRWATLRPRQGQPWLDWFKGGGFLVFHIDLFLLGIAALVLVNIARSPGHIWVGGVFWRWGLLLVIHGMVTLLIWLISMLLSEERPGAGTYEAEWSAVPRDANRPPVVVEPVDADTASAPWASSPEPSTSKRAPADGWRAAPEAPPADEWHTGFEQRTSWSETTASAWLARRRSEPESAASTASDESTEPSAEHA